MSYVAAVFYPTPVMYECMFRTVSRFSRTDVVALLESTRSYWNVRRSHVVEPLVWYLDKDTLGYCGRDFAAVRFTPGVAVSDWFQGGPGHHIIPGGVFSPTQPIAFWYFGSPQHRFLAEFTEVLGDVDDELPPNVAARVRFDPIRNLPNFNGLWDCYVNTPDAAWPAEERAQLDNICCDPVEVSQTELDWVRGLTSAVRTNITGPQPTFERINKFYGAHPVRSDRRIRPMPLPV